MKIDVDGSFAPTYELDVTWDAYTVTAASFKAGFDATATATLDVTRGQL